MWQKGCESNPLSPTSCSPSLMSVCVCVCVLVTQLCLQPMDYSLPGSSVHGILQAGIHEWVAIPFPGDLPITIRVSYITGRFFTIWTTRVMSEMIPNFPYPWKEQSGNPEILMSIERHWGHEESLEKKDQRPTETIVFSVGRSQDGCPSLTLNPPPPSPPVTLKRIKSRNPEKTAFICIDRIP